MDKKDFQAEFPGANPQGENRFERPVIANCYGTITKVFMVVDSHRPSGEDAGSGRG